MHKFIDKYEKNILLSANEICINLQAMCMSDKYSTNVKISNNKSAKLKCSLSENRMHTQLEYKHNHSSLFP